ncbi:MAG: XdhC family protein [Acetobacteraceae bacterium]|nr:XdhC family protein [Acetobacteraceae bacterium]
MTPDIIAALQQARRENRPIVLATRLPSGEQQLVPHPAAPADLNEAAQRVLRDDKSGTTKLQNGEWFLHAYNPPLRLIVVGAVHIAQALVPFASQCGFAVTVVDPRRSFASDERFPNVTVSTAWPDEAMDEMRPDARTAVVTLTHDPKLDDPALDRALKSPAFYIGALGSRRTHAARLGRLRELGHKDVALARIQGPVGLNIEAVTAPEIALSIMAEIVAVRRGASVPQKRAA